MIPTSPACRTWRPEYAAHIGAPRWPTVSYTTSRDTIKDASHARRVGAALEREIGVLWAGFEDGVPVQNSSEEQGIFFVGYYQERFAPKIATDVSVENIVEDEVRED